MPMVRMGIWATEVLDEVEAARSDQGIEAPRAELADLGLEVR